MIDMRPLTKQYGKVIPLKAFAAYVNNAGMAPVSNDPVTGMFDVMEKYPEESQHVAVTIETKE